MAILVWLATAYAAQSFEARVMSVPDSGSVVVVDRVRGMHKVRIGGVLAVPRGHPVFPQAKQLLERLMLRRWVLIEWESQSGDYKVGRILVGKNDVGLQLIARGFARYDPSYRDRLSTPDRTLYVEAEEKAQKFRRGIWANRKPARKK